MTSNAVLSHQDVYSNIKTFERYEPLEKKEVYGFGVMQGKRFTLIKKSDSFFSKIRFIFLRLLRYVKVDQNSIDKLKEYSLDHCKCKEYRVWAKDNGKISLEGRLNLLEANENLESLISEQQKELQEHKGLTENLQNDVECKQQEICDFQTSLNEARSETATARADVEKVHLILSKKENEIADLKKQFQSEVDRLKEKEKKQINTIKNLKKENLYYVTGWKELNPEKTIRQFLKEADLYEMIRNQFHSKKKTHKEKLVNADS